MEEPADGRLADAVAHELTSATRRLPERQREALALRERFELSYEELSEEIGIDAAAVGPLLARARLRLRTELRGPLPPQCGICPERERSLRALARRQDGEPPAGCDADWLTEHLGACLGCRQCHAAMLEASLCYRAWQLDFSPSAATPGADDSGADDPADPCGPGGPGGPGDSADPADPHDLGDPDDLGDPTDAAGGANGDRSKHPFLSRFRDALAADARR